MSATRLTSRSLVHISGRDTFKYLQSYTTNNLARPRSQYTAFLSAQGRILYDCFIYLDPGASTDGQPACMLECDAVQRDELVAHLKRYKLRSKFVLREVDSDELSAYAIASGPDSSDDSPLKQSLASTHHQLDPRAPGLGTRALLRPDSPLLSTLASTSLSSYARKRYVRGVAEGAGELVPGSALPMESNLDHCNGVDFHKGCYLGQELTVRTYHTGVIRKRILPVRLFPRDGGGGQPPAELESDLDTDAAMEIDAPETKPEVRWRGVEGRNARAGKLLASVGDVGIALLKLDGIEHNLIGETDAASNLLLKPFLPKHWPRKGATTAATVEQIAD